jgi:hypothetical protein
LEIGKVKIRAARFCFPVRIIHYQLQISRPFGPAILGGIREKRKEKKEEQQSQAAQQNSTNSFKNAYKACMEGKGYTSE